MTHQFIKVTEIDKSIGGEVGVSRTIPGAIVVCAECGQVRNVYANGGIYTSYKGLKPCQNQKQ